MGMIGKLPGGSMCYESIMEEINAKRLKRQSMTTGTFSIISQEMLGEFRETYDERKEAKVPCAEEDFKGCAAFTRNEKNLQSLENADEGMKTKGPIGNISVKPREDELEIISKKETDKNPKDATNNRSKSSSSQKPGQQTSPSSSECGKKELKNSSKMKNYVQSEAEFTEAQFRKASDKVFTELRGVDTISADNSDFDKSIRPQSLEKCAMSKRNITQKNHKEYVAECCLPSALENFDSQTVGPEIPEMNPPHSDDDSASTNMNPNSLTNEGICVSRNAGIC